jgi:hypothetical protein
MFRDNEAGGHATCYVCQTPFRILDAQEVPVHASKPVPPLRAQPSEYRDNNKPEFLRIQVPGLAVGMGWAAAVSALIVVVIGVAVIRDRRVDKQDVNASKETMDLGNIATEKRDMVQFVTHPPEPVPAKEVYNPEVRER